MAKFTLRNALIGSVVAVAALGLTAAGCESDASRVSENLSTEADQFKMNRQIIGVNGITGEVMFSVTGACSITRDGDLVVICKEGENVYKKHYFGLSDNTFYVSTQLEPVEASAYRTKIILKPTNIVPDYDLQVGI